MRLLVRVTGHLVPSKMIGADLDGDPACALVHLIDQAAQALGATKSSGVRIFLDGGHDVDDVSLLEKDDLLYFSFDGGAWRTPVDLAPYIASDSQPDVAAVAAAIGATAMIADRVDEHTPAAVARISSAAQNITDEHVTDAAIMAAITATDATLAWSAARLRAHLSKHGIAVSEKRLKRLKNAASQPASAPAAQPEAAQPEAALPLPTAAVGRTPAPPPELVPLERDELLAVISADVLMAPDILREEGMDGTEHPPGRYTGPRMLAAEGAPRLLCDLRLLKAHANDAFAAGDMIGALEHYDKFIRAFKLREGRVPEELGVLAELMAVVHANRAQVVLNRTLTLTLTLTPILTLTLTLALTPTLTLPTLATSCDG